ncbi:MAG: DNA-directed RNA polymerase subunit K [Nitrososphaerota archaeon]|nr:DNA-directed RNA polymerase subunit K [Nitrososphaerota archaeon]
MPGSSSVRPRTTLKAKVKAPPKAKRTKAPLGKPVRPARTTKSTVRKLDKIQEVKQGRIGPDHLTRFERARILGARALQLSFGAPPMIPQGQGANSPISIATAELEAAALPISIRRVLPSGQYQNLPLKSLL